MFGEVSRVEGWHLRNYTQMAEGGNADHRT